MSSKKKIPQPVEKGVVKVPVVMQLEVLECGAASLTMNRPVLTAVCHVTVRRQKISLWQRAAMA